MPVLLPGEVPHRWQGHCYLRELFPTNTMSSRVGAQTKAMGAGRAGDMVEGISWCGCRKGEEGGRQLWC